MDQEVAALQENEPFIMQLTSDNDYQYIITVECKAFFGFHNIRDTYIMLFSCYIIKYPHLPYCALLSYNISFFHCLLLKSYQGNFTQLYSVLVKM